MWSRQPDTWQEIRKLAKSTKGKKIASVDFHGFFIPQSPKPSISSWIHQEDNEIFDMPINLILVLYFVFLFSSKREIRQTIINSFKLPLATNQA